MTSPYDLPSFRRMRAARSNVLHFPRWAEPLGRRARLARIAATDVGWPLLRRLPGESTRFGPPRRFADSVVAWAGDHPEVTLRGVDAAEVWNPPLPEQSANQIPELFHIVRHHKLFPTWVAHIPGGRVFGRDATVVTHDDTVFGELLNSWPKSYRYHEILLRPRLPAPKRIRGRVAVVGALFANSYYHWLVDILPRVRLLATELPRLDWIVVPSGHPFQRETLQAAGVALDRLIEPTSSLHLVADELVVPSLVPRVSTETVPYLQSLFANDSSVEPPRRRLYVTRAHMWRRRVENEHELQSALAPLGFETVVPDRLSVPEQARLFSAAEVVVGPHGGAMTNVVFSRPGVKLVELCDSNYVIAAIWELVARAQGHYRVLVSPSPPGTSQWRDINVAIEQLLQMLDSDGIRP